MSLVGVLFFVVSSGIVQAANFPPDYTSETCDSVCTTVPLIGGLKFIVCELTDFVDDSGADAWAVTDFENDDDINFSVWGTDGTDKFACFFDDPDNEICWVLVIGTEYEDTIAFDHPGYKANLHSPIASTAFYGDARGLAGADELLGSSDTDDVLTSCSGHEYGYADYLYGGGGIDDIDGKEGGDILSGGDAADTIHGGDESDCLLGGDGNDTLFGEDGRDVVFGNDDDDAIDGGLLGDLLDGGLGNDYVCGGSLYGQTYSDDLNGGIGNDYLWSPYSVSISPTGTDTGGTNYCGHSVHGSFLTSGSCTYNLTSEPGGCP